MARRRLQTANMQQTIRWINEGLAKRKVAERLGFTQSINGVASLATRHELHRTCLGSNFEAFEQTDYSRHLDEIAKEAERLSFEAIQESLLKDRTEDAIELIVQWEAYRELKDSINQTMEEEIKLFLRKTGKLQGILKVLKKNDHTQAVFESLEERLDSVTKSVESECSLNAGGKFEWVNSILIKCLQDGSWLLVDNVNLCSSAVLDRLNALLEPNGVLTLSERGVDQDGNMIEVRPHKDFRMFFTMDPKNGEISRAMRNRGIELYMLDDNEEGKLNELDTMSLINLEGLDSTVHIKILMKIHAFLSGLILGEKPTIKELLQASSLISQQLTCERSLFNIFFSTVVEVYYKTRSAMEFDSNNAISTIKDEIERYLKEFGIVENNTEVVPSEVFNCGVTLRTQNIGVSSVVEKVRQHSTMLLDRLPHKNELDLLNLCANFYAVSSIEDLDTRHFYVKSKLANENLLGLIEDLYKVISNTKNTTTASLPLDHNWVPKTMHQEGISHMSNKLNLILLLASYYFSEKIDEDKIKSNKKKQVMLLDYMYEKGQKKIEDKFNDVIINNYLLLIKGFDEYLNNIPSKIVDITNENVIHVLLLILWRFTFHKCTLTNIKKLSSADQYNVLVNLSIHYKWFYKNSIRKLSALSQVDIPKDLENILNIINSKMDRHFSVVQKFGKCYQKHCNRTPPFVSHDQLKAVAEYNNIKYCYDLSQRGNDATKIINAFSSEKTLRTLLIDIKTKLNYNFQDVSEDLNSLKTLHDKCSSVNPKEGLNKFELELMPILDVFTCLEIRTEIFGNHTNTLTNNILVPTDLCGTLALYHQTKDDRLVHEIKKLYYLYMMNSASAKPCQYLAKTDEKAIDLSGFNPKVTYFFNSLLVNVDDTDNSARITLGNFRNLIKQHNTLSLILWRNVHQLSGKTYDYIHCEVEHITKSHGDFIVELAKSLKIDLKQQESSQLSTTKIIAALEEMKKINKLSDYDDQLYKLTKHLQKCSTDLMKLDNTVCLNEKLLTISDLYMELGFLKATLNSKLSPIDPLVKKTLKRKFCERATETFTSMKKCYELQNEIYSNTINTLHAYHEPLKKIIVELNMRDQELSEYVAVRPENMLYETVLKVVNHAFNTILSENNVAKMSSTLNYLILNILEAFSDESDIDYRYFVDALAKHESTVASYENLIHEWNRFKTSYPDVIEPLLSNVAEFLYGLKMKLSVLKKCLSEYEYFKCGININEDLVNFIKLPILDEKQNKYSTYLEKFTSKKMNNFINHIFEDSPYTHVKNRENFRLLKCGIQETFNHCVIDAKGADVLDKNLFMQFT
ncbi:hypothetical protein JTB14_009680 [Gonioctena quinquepunctata]|nr:hypothetical protein JTB14_009680 [Gonioctena quinquepunctata]